MSPLEQATDAFFFWMLRADGCPTVKAQRARQLGSASSLSQPGARILNPPPPNLSPRNGSRSHAARTQESAELLDPTNPFLPGCLKHWSSWPSMFKPGPMHNYKDKEKERRKKKEESSNTNYTSHTSIPTYPGNGQKGSAGIRAGIAVIWLLARIETVIQLIIMISLEVVLTFLAFKAWCQTAQPRG